jgi:hypothetical protein
MIDGRLIGLGIFLAVILLLVVSNGVHAEEMCQMIFCPV